MEEANTEEASEMHQELMQGEIKTLLKMIILQEEPPQDLDVKNLNKICAHVEIMVRANLS